MSVGIEELIDNYLSTLDTKDIDSFKNLVSRSIQDEFTGINSRFEPDKQINYKNRELEQIDYEWIADDVISINDISILADQLAITALYKLFEKNIKELIGYHTKCIDISKYSYWKNVKAVLPIKAKNLQCFQSVNELRLINNAIKHEGVVTLELSTEFPAYGKVGTELSGLDEMYIRLKPCVINFINELHYIYKS
ncbi:conserved hypothetical protein [Candidatus Methylobacter favarea]|uniref:Uncharacterized protein n=1 Tax=Candidatus Methylobacter favarea TaxID=2707345 RepID=A0A8S0WRP8_9GAMM|nr:hypothetical protein [Candidatus Methylobacter favarea]CAA9892181.1 conserved hypothetical protein [Candidatus Methylobacter favarea]